MAKVYTKPGSFSAATIAALKAVLNIVTGNSGGNARGTNAADFQLTRESVDQVASAANGFIAGGKNNKIAAIVIRDSDPTDGFAAGRGNRIIDWAGGAIGSTNLNDSKIGVVFGNSNVLSANDSVVNGNLNAGGRRSYYNITTGSEDAGSSLGVLQFVLIPALEGDVTSFFPNPLTDAVTTRYGAGAQMDAKGNIYASGFTPAVWTGDVPTTPNNLRWALHSQAVVRGPAEVNIEYINIKKATYAAETGTKVYYSGAMPFASLTCIMSSYAPGVSVGNVFGGNGHNVSGRQASSWGYAAFVAGFRCRAWAYAADAGNYFAQALGNYSFARNYYTKARGENSFAIGHTTEAIGKTSVATGLESIAKRELQQSYATGKRVVAGDDQSFKIAYSGTYSNAGWWQIHVLRECEDLRAYNLDIMVLGRQIAGTAGTVGDTFAYRFQACVKRDGSTYTVLGTPIRTLIGRDAGMSGDGLTTGARMSWTAPTAGATNRIELRFDGLLDTTFRIQTLSNIQEIVI